MLNIYITSDFNEAIEKRYKKYFRFNNSKYWSKYYTKKLQANDFSRERLYASIIAKKIGQGGKVLDVGSGYGFLAKELFEKNLNVHCIDLFNEMISLAKNYLKNTNVELRQADILRLPYEKSSFDCISLMSILEHFPIEEASEDILPYIHKFIKKDGYLFVHVPVRTMYSKFARFVRRYLTQDLPSWAIDDDGDITHKIWINYKSYIKLIESNGFELINFDFRLKRSNDKPEILAGIIRLLESYFSDSDPAFDQNFAEENFLIKIRKLIKSNFAMTSYLLFRKVE